MAEVRTELADAVRRAELAAQEHDELRDVRKKERELGRRLAEEVLRLRKEGQRKDGIAVQAIKQIKLQLAQLNRPEVQALLASLDGGDDTGGRDDAAAAQAADDLAKAQSDEVIAALREDVAKVEAEAVDLRAENEALREKLERGAVQLAASKEALQTALKQRAVESAERRDSHAEKWSVPGTTQKTRKTSMKLMKPF